MTWHRQRIEIAGIAALLAIGIAACTGAPDGPGIAGNPDGVGVVTNVPSISGTWLLENTITSDSCASIDPQLSQSFVLRLSQVNTELQVELFDSCGALLAAGDGSVTPGGVLQTTASAGFDLSDTCGVTVDVAIAGTVDTAQDQLEGSVTLDFAPGATWGPDCDDTFPCRIEAMFVADQCPPADCSFATCGD